MSKKITFNLEARDALKRGVDALANAVKVTLGPKGRNVIIHKQFGGPSVTKDGVSVAREIFLEDAIEDMGAQMVKEVASRTADVAGDGTTTATVLAQAIVTAGLKNVAAGANPMDLKRGIDKAVIAVVASLKGMSHIVKEDSEKIKQVATISANNDAEIGALIANAMEKVKREGVITVEEAKSTETTVEILEGMQFDRGYIAPHFATNPEKMEAVLENPLIILHDKKISSMTDLLPVIEKAMKTQKPILIIAEDVDGEALTTLVINKLRGNLRVCAVKAPAFGERRNAILEDLAVLTGGKLITDTKGFRLENAGLDMLGKAEKVIVARDRTTIIGGAGKKTDIDVRITEIKGQMENSSSEYDKEKLQERLAKLAGGVAVLYVGAATEVEMKEKKDRVDDALHATRAAVEEGIVPGGGVAYIRAQSALEMVGDNNDETTGIQIVYRALEEPIRQICANAGVEGSIVMQKVREGENDFGFNARTETYEKLYDAGVIDPTKVVRVALENAASVAGMLLTTECVISEKAKPVKSEEE